MSSSTLDDFGKLILRVTIGILLLMHGIAKISNGIGPIESMVVARGLPAFVAWGIYVGEVIAPLLLILGIYTRLGGLLVVFTLIAAITLAHTGHLTQLSNSGGWRLELQGLFLFGGLAVAFLGAGAYSLGGRGGRWN
ncbi:MAG: DoxX family protein [Burkholderiaceae bacterium]|nr:DoxX family protein [Burkholderiaceae bacterium]